MRECKDGVATPPTTRTVTDRRLLSERPSYNNDVHVGHAALYLGVLANLNHVVVLPSDSESSGRRGHQVSHLPGCGDSEALATLLPKVDWVVRVDHLVVESSKKLSEKTWQLSSTYRIPAPAMSMSVLLVVPSTLHDLVIFVDVGRL